MCKSFQSTTSQSLIFLLCPLDITVPSYQAVAMMKLYCFGGHLIKCWLVGVILCNLPFKDMPYYGSLASKCRRLPALVPVEWGL